MIQPQLHHPWNLTETEALRLQQEWARKVIREDQLADPVQTIAGIDVAYQQAGDQMLAAVVVLRTGTLLPVEIVTAQDQGQFPYIPGLFSFREIPPVIKAFEKLTIKPDLIICDGQGLAHPRRFGLACHLGVLFDIPTIGCGKTRLLGTFAKPAEPRGSFSDLMDSSEIIGSALRTQPGINPLFVSTGHRISLPTARQWILQLSQTYRQPEPIRLADQTVNALLKSL